MNIENLEKKYHTASHRTYSCQYHVIFCPKYRRRVLVGGIDVRLKELLIEKQVEYHYVLLAAEVMPDHVHILIDVDPYWPVHRVVTNIKGYLSRILRDEFPKLKSRLPSLWTHGKFISTIGSVSLEVVKQYIDNQKGRIQ